MAWTQPGGWPGRQPGPPAGSSGCRRPLTLPVGTTVTWKFDDSTQHTVNADDNSFASSAMANGQTFTHTFTSAGTVSYHCSIHPFMKGTIVVT